MKNIAAFLIAPMAVSTLLYAAEATIADEDVTYKAKAELSYVDTSGNTETSSFALEFNGDAKWDEVNTLSLHLDVLQSNSNGTEDNNKWNTSLQYDRDLTEKLYFNYIIAYGEDRFSGFDYKFNTGPGIGYKVLDNDIHKLTTQANALYSKDKYDDGNVNEYVSWVIGFDYEWQILENLKFSQKAWFKSQADEFENNFIHSKTAFESKITDIFSFGVSYKIDYANKPSAGKEYTDKTLLASLIINYN